MDICEFNYELPKEFIAQYPLKKRDEAKLLVLHRKTQKIEHRIFKDIVDYFAPGDCLVLNNTKVIPARLYGHKPTGGKVEVLLVHQKENNIWEALANPARRLKTGVEIVFKDGLLTGKILSRTDNGNWTVEFKTAGDFIKVLEEIGVAPLPHYINRPAEPNDRLTYQTIYAQETGAIAAPTAGIHFTPELLAAIEKKGVKTTFVTLHIGIGTFRPIKVHQVEEHKMDAEYYEISKPSAEIINSAIRVFAVGTSAVRSLEHSALNGNKASAWADLFIYPPYHFKVVDHLITNFHLPCSTPLLLVSAFAGLPCGIDIQRGKELIFQAYDEAKKYNYRFLSYGDAMVII
jgi:S-adenosylmethionine:tRNA ribosyltransferase-isomerase